MGESRKKRMSYRKVRKRIDEADWDDLIPRLLWFARYQILAKIWLGRPGGAAPGGMSEEDFVNQAIEKLLDGRCTCPEDESVTLFQVICGIIRSDIGTLVRRKENRETRRASHSSGDDEDSPCFSKLKDQRFSNPLSELELDEFREQILAEFKEDPFVCKYVNHCLDADIADLTPAATAAALGMDVRDVYEMKRRLRKGLWQWILKWSPAESSGFVAKLEEKK